MFDPKLKQAAEEIKAILKKHDILASLLLVSPTHAEFLYHLESSWSVMSHQTPPDGSDKMHIRIRSKKEDFPSKKKQDQAIEATLYAITSFLQFGKKTTGMMEDILTMLRKHMRVFYKVWSDTPDDKL